MNVSASQLSVSSAIANLKSAQCTCVQGNELSCCRDLRHLRWQDASAFNPTVSNIYYMRIGSRDATIINAAGVECRTATPQGDTTVLHSSRLKSELHLFRLLWICCTADCPTNRSNALSVSTCCILVTVLQPVPDQFFTC